MKLLMENWRSYVAETEKSSIYGKMYLFEDQNIREVSFYEHLNQLNENGDDVERFLEKWERSVDHMFESIDEQAGQGAIDDAILKASTQAWMALDKLKGKAASSVINVMKKLKDYEQKNPNAAKAIKITVAGLAAATAAVGVYQIMKSGGDADAAQELAQALSAVEPDVAQDVAEVAQNLTPESAVELVNSQEQTVSQVADTLAQSGDQGLQQVAQAAEQVETSTFEDIMSDLQAERGAGGEDVGDTEFVDLKTQGDQLEDKYGPYAVNSLGNLPDGPKKDALLQAAEQQWTKYKEIRDVLESGGDLGDLDMSRKDFNQWATEAIWAPKRADTILKSVGRGLKYAFTGGPFNPALEEPGEIGIGWVPPEHMKALRQLVRQSMNTKGL